MRLYVIGDRETVLGFGLVGVEGSVVTGAEEASGALSDAVAKKGLGVVLITERVAATIRDAVDARLYSFGFPLVLQIPDAQGPAPSRRSVAEAVRKAVGMAL